MRDVDILFKLKEIFWYLKIKQIEITRSKNVAAFVEVAK